MNIKNRWYVSLAALPGVALLAMALLAIPGCGGSGGKGDGAETRGMGTVTFTVEWPKPGQTRLLPSASQSVRIELRQTGYIGPVEPVIITRAEAQTSTKSVRVFVGSYDVRITAHPDPTGTGVAQAEARTPVTVTFGQDTAVPITLASTINVTALSSQTLPERRTGRLEAGSNQSDANWSIQLPALPDTHAEEVMNLVAFDAASQVVLLDPVKVRWTISTTPSSPGRLRIRQFDPAQGGPDQVEGDSASGGSINGLPVVIAGLKTTYQNGTPMPVRVIAEETESGKKQTLDVNVLPVVEAIVPDPATVNQGESREFQVRAPSSNQGVTFKVVDVNGNPVSNGGSFGDTNFDPVTGIARAIYTAPADPAQAADVKTFIIRAESVDTPQVFQNGTVTVRGLMADVSAEGTPKVGGVVRITAVINSTNKDVLWRVTGPQTPALSTTRFIPPNGDPQADFIVPQQVGTYTITVYVNDNGKLGAKIGAVDVVLQTGSVHAIVQ